MAETKLSQLGIVGLGVMAGAYSRNLYFRGFIVSTWTRNEKEIEVFEFKLKNDKESQKSSSFGEVKCFTNLQEFIDSLEKPRKILMFITAGNPVDSMLDRLIPSLDKDDILVDGGNEWYKNTESRILRCKEEGIRFSGMGTSGGERGARTHPCFMFGGNKEDYDKLKPLLSQDNKDFYVGPGSSGHYVKMVHNGIEYAILQVICELYKLMKHVNGMNNLDISNVFKEWDEQDHSYLLKITHMILTQKDGEDYIVDKINPCISSNGTGKWTVQDSFERGVPVPSIGISVDMRSFSNMDLNSNLNNEKANDDKKSVKFDLKDLKSTYLCTIVSVFSQGFHLLQEASKQFKWNLKMDEIADIWSRNAIISCDLLKEVSESYKDNDKLLLMHPKFLEMVSKKMESWRLVVNKCVEHNLPSPAVLTSLQYVQVFLSKNHCHNLIQAQRDCFGSHCFERVDKPGKHHHDWWNSCK